MRKHRNSPYHLLTAPVPPEPVRAGRPACSLKQEALRESEMPTTFPTPRTPWASSSRHHIPREGREGEEHTSPREKTAKSQSKLKKANSNNTGSMLPFVFQKTQNRIACPDVHVYICKSTEQSN